MKTDDARTIAAQQLDALLSLAQTMTKLTAHFAGQVINDVLEVGTVVMPAGGSQPLSWQVAAGSIVIDNQGTHPMTVTSAGPTGAGAPTSGLGVTIVPANSRRVISVASRQVTVYGTAADVFCYQAFTAAAQPVVS